MLSSGMGACQRDIVYQNYLFVSEYFRANYLEDVFRVPLPRTEVPPAFAPGFSFTVVSVMPTILIVESPGQLSTLFWPLRLDYTKSNGGASPR